MQRYVVLVAATCCTGRAALQIQEIEIVPHIDRQMVAHVKASPSLSGLMHHEVLHPAPPNPLSLTRQSNPKP